MNEILSTRRQVIIGTAAALAGVTVSSKILAQASSAKSGAKDPRTSLHQEVSLRASPQRIYETLLDAKLFTAFSGAPAEIDPRPGGTFAMFGGQIVGRNIELVPFTRIVQAWRPAHWDAGVYSLVRFDLKPHEAGTAVALDHTSFPEGDFDSLSWGWNNHYWEPLKKYFPSG